MHRLNIILIAVAIAGAVVAAYRGRDVRQLAGKRDDLVARFGYLPVDDHSKPCFVRMETDDPMHFRWRMYIPGKFRARIQDQNGSSNTFSNTDPREIIADVKFRVIDDRLQVFHKFGGGSGLRSVGSARLADFLQQNWDELDIEVGGSDGPAIVDLDEKELLIRIRVPDSLRDAAEEKLDSHEIGRLAESVLTLHFGDSTAFRD